MEEEGSTVRVKKIPLTAIAKELFDYLEGTVGKGSIFALEIFTEGRNWKSRGHGRVQFETSADAFRALDLSRHGRLQFQHSHLEISRLRHAQIVQRPLRHENRLVGGSLHSGTMLSDDSMISFAVFEVDRGTPESNRIDLWVRFNSYILGHPPQVTAPLVIEIITSI